MKFSKNIFSIHSTSTAPQRPLRIQTDREEWRPHSSVTLPTHYRRSQPLAIEYLRAAMSFTDKHHCICTAGSPYEIEDRYHQCQKQLKHMDLNLHSQRLRHRTWQPGVQVFLRLGPCQRDWNYCWNRGCPCLLFGDSGLCLLQSSFAMN